MLVCEAYVWGARADAESRPRLWQVVLVLEYLCVFFFSSRRRHTRLQGDWSSDVCSSDLEAKVGAVNIGGQALSHVMLGVIDEKWKDHLYDLDQLKAAIHYRQWGQKDPLIEYKREGYEMFVGLMRDVHATFAERWLKLQIEIGPPPQRGAPSGPGGRPPASPASGPGAGL